MRAARNRMAPDPVPVIPRVIGPGSATRLPVANSIWQLFRDSPCLARIYIRSRRRRFPCHTSNSIPEASSRKDAGQSRSNHNALIARIGTGTTPYAQRTATSSARFPASSTIRPRGDGVSTSTSRAHAAAEARLATMVIPRTFDMEGSMCGVTSATRTPRRSVSARSRTALWSPSRYPRLATSHMQLDSSALARAA